MNTLEKSRALVVSARHTSQTVQRLVSAIARCGFAVEYLQYRRQTGTNNAVAVVVLDFHLASRDLDHLARVVDGTVDVLWAQPLAALRVASAVDASFAIDSFEVATRKVGAHIVSEARLSAVVDGQRNLAAAEDCRSVRALTCAIMSVLRQSGIRDATLHVTDLWTCSSRSGRALVFAESHHRGQIAQVIGIGRDELEATALALSDLASLMVKRSEGGKAHHRRAPSEEPFCTTASAHAPYSPS